MINKRLLKEMSDSKKYIYINVLFQWISLISQIIIIVSMAVLIDLLFSQKFNHKMLLVIFAIIIVMICIRYMCQIYIANFSHKASEKIKIHLREKIYSKLLQLEKNGKSPLSSSEIVQLSVEGVDQLEIYFGRYLPQFIYSMIAPLTLFLFLMTISFKVALVLLICVPLIPISIILVQKFAKKLLGKYWGLYTNLGDRFLDNIRGLTTLKIYGSDQYMHEKMNEEAEKFRKATMRVLIMQLNSISIMDLVAFGGAAIGIILTIKAYLNLEITIGQAFILMMLSAEFFIPLRLLGSFFHIAMNGNAASSKIFKLLDTKVECKNYSSLKVEKPSIEFDHVSFCYHQDNILNDISFTINCPSLTSIVGKSGCGKSTLVALMTNQFDNYTGKIKTFGQSLNHTSKSELMKHMVVVSHNSYLFKGTVRSNLLMANPTATDEQLYDVLKQVNLYDFVNSISGLDTPINERGSNLSGGQQQRLNLARALLHEAKIYIFDEATSNIDVESENDIIKVIKQLSKTKIVVMVSHRLANVVTSDSIIVMDQGRIVEQGTHEQLMSNHKLYCDMFNTQLQLENYLGGGSNA